MKRITTRTFKLLAFVALLAVVSAASANDPNSTSALHNSPPDVEFLDMMMLHHQGGIEMARMAEQKATLPRLKEFATKAAADQQRDIEKMKESRDRLFANVSKADKMRMKSKTVTKREMERQSQADMRRLEAASGSEFDLVFLDILTKHHQMALQMSRNEIARGEQSEVKEMARETINKQTKEIAEMGEMKKQAGGGSGH